MRGAGMKHAIIVLCGFMLAASASYAGGASDVVIIPTGRFRSVLPVATGQDVQTIGSFGMQRTPVTNAQFAQFIARNPAWRRDRIARLFADSSYLSHWASSTRPGMGMDAQPVTQVSWFAATAYCEAQGGRLPTWREWEYAAAADEQRRDARDIPQYRQSILNWYSVPNSELLPVGRSAPNVYGVQDLHGLVWEWVQDFNSLLVSGDSREQGGSDVRQFCGSGALAMEQKENYAIMMRVAMLSSLQAKYTTANVGFRCVFDVPGNAR